MKLKKLLPKLEKVVIWYALSFVVSVVSILLHNFISGALGVEEPVFFTLSMLAMFVYGMLSLYLVVVGLLMLFKVI